MKLCMAGIDFQTAEVKVREQFVFSDEAAVDALKLIKEKYPHVGCALLSTCNRTELWVSGSLPNNIAAHELLVMLQREVLESMCALEFEEHFVSMVDEEAAEHLFFLASGLKSQIKGEDQILSQVKNALTLARKAGTANSVIERAFQMAIASAKRVKSETVLGQADLSVVSRVMEVVEDAYGKGPELSCLVVGNGVIGRKMAESLLAAGHKVSITLRRYGHADTIVPAGCTTISYENRYEHLAQCEVIVSATTSPHRILTLEKTAIHLAQKTENKENTTGLEDMSLSEDRCRQKLFFDLAMPLDIEENVGMLEGCALYNIDMLADESISTHVIELKKAESIIKEGLDEFVTWVTFRDYLSVIEEIKSAVSEDILARTSRSISHLSSEAEQEELRDSFNNACNMVLGKMLFGLRETLDEEVWNPCFSALAMSAKKPAVYNQKRYENKVHDNRQQAQDRKSA